MKKLLAIILISLMLLSSCADVDKSDSGSGGDTAPMFDVLSVTNVFPTMSKGYNEKDNPPPTMIDYVVQMENKLSKEQMIEILTYTTNITLYVASLDAEGKEYQSYDVEAEVSGIIDDKEKFITFYEGFTDERYSDRFPDKFFEDNIVLIIYFGIKGYDSPFVKLDYSFDSETNDLNLLFTTRPHEGWGNKAYDAVLRGSAYIIPIAKSDLTVDGKLVPYEELNIAVSRKLTVE